MKIRKDVIELCFGVLGQRDGADIHSELLELKALALTYLTHCIRLASDQQELNSRPVVGIDWARAMPGDVIHDPYGREFVLHPVANQQSAPRPGLAPSMTTARPTAPQHDYLADALRGPRDEVAQ